MIYGNIRLEDTIIDFTVNYSDNTVHYSVVDILAGERESFIVPQDKFFKALAIAVHNDGTPDYEKDYPDAESIMGKIRWIP